MSHILRRQKVLVPDQTDSKEYMYHMHYKQNDPKMNNLLRKFIPNGTYDSFHILELTLIRDLSLRERYKNANGY